MLEAIAKLYPLDSLGLYNFTDSLIMLLVLGTVQRVQTFALMKLSNIWKFSRV